MVLSLLLALVSVANPEAQAATLVYRLGINGCDTTQGFGVSAYAVSPDTQTVAVLRSQLPAKGNEKQGIARASGDELALLDLRDGRTVATGPTLSNPFPIRLAMSADGRTVVAARKLDDAMHSPYGISVWKPYSDPAVLRDYSFAGGTREGGFASYSGSLPAVSPEGARVAAFVHLFSEGHESEEPSDNAIGVLDLESGKVTVIPLPIAMPVGPQHLWHLGWSTDGSSLYAVLHGTWSDERHAEVLPGKPRPLARRPDLTLYRFTLATGLVTRVGGVPPSTIGFGPGDDLIVADALRGGWGPHRAFALLPIAQVEEGKVQGEPISLAFVAGLKMETVVPSDDAVYSSFQKVFVGRSHTYAEVEKKGTNDCTALVERTTAASASE
jgi:hypothetical protein